MTATASAASAAAAHNLLANNWATATATATVDRIRETTLEKLYALRDGIPRQSQQQQQGQQQQQQQNLAMHRGHQLKQALWPGSTAGDGCGHELPPPPSPVQPFQLPSSHRARQNDVSGGGSGSGSSHQAHNCTIDCRDSGCLGSRTQYTVACNNRSRRRNGRREPCLHKTVLLLGVLRLCESDQLPNWDDGVGNSCREKSECGCASSVGAESLIQSLEQFDAIHEVMDQQREQPCILESENDWFDACMQQLDDDYDDEDVDMPVAPSPSYEVGESIKLDGAGIDIDEDEETPLSPPPVTPLLDALDDQLALVPYNQNDSNHSSNSNNSNSGSNTTNSSTDSQKPSTASASVIPSFQWPVFLAPNQPRPTIPLPFFNLTKCPLASIDIPSYSLSLWPQNGAQPIQQQVVKRLVDYFEHGAENENDTNNFTLY